MPADQLWDLGFPVAGLDLSEPLPLQPPDTTPVGVNVRAYEPASDRLRGASRTGTSQYIPQAIANPVQMVDTIVSTSDRAFGVGGGYWVPKGAAIDRALFLIGNDNSTTHTWELYKGNVQLATGGLSGFGEQVFTVQTDGTDFYYVSRKFFAPSTGWYLVKVSAQGVELWRTFLGPRGGTAPGWTGRFAVVGGVVYTVGSPITSTNAPAEGIYRHNAATGVALAGNPWVNQAQMQALATGTAHFVGNLFFTGGLFMCTLQDAAPNPARVLVVTTGAGISAATILARQSSASAQNPTAGPAEIYLDCFSTALPGIDMVERVTSAGVRTWEKQFINGIGIPPFLGYWSGPTAGAPSLQASTRAVQSTGTMSVALNPLTGAVLGPGVGDFRAFYDVGDGVCLRVDGAGFNALLFDGTTTYTIPVQARTFPAGYVVS